MTLFNCRDCPCDCPTPCLFTTANCFKISFSGFLDSPEVDRACTPCGTLDQHTVIVRRGELDDLEAQATAVRQEQVDSVPSSEPAEFSVTMSQNPTTGAYTVESVEVIDGGSGYAPGAEITFLYGREYEGVFGAIAAVVRCDREPFAWITGFTRGQPVVGGSLSPGDFSTAPVIETTLSETTDADGEPAWEVASASIAYDGSGSGITDGATVTFSASNGTTVDQGTGVVWTERAQPSVSLEFRGTSAYGSVTLSESSDTNGRSVWGISSITGFFTPESPAPAPGEEVAIILGDDATVISEPAATISSVDQFGVPSIQVSTPGQFYVDRGWAETVEVTTAGLYYKPGVIESVEVIEGGEIYDTTSQYACFFSGQTCISCPTGRLAVRLTLSAGQEGLVNASLRVTLGAGVLVGEAIDIQPNATSMTFSSFSEQSLCPTAGTIIATNVACDTAVDKPCGEMPSQIALTLSGLSGGGRRYGSSVEQLLEAQQIASAQCESAPAISCSYYEQPSSFAVQTSQGFFDQTVILDLVSSDCGSYIYFPQQGVSPASWSYDHQTDSLDCESFFIGQPSFRIESTPCQTFASIERQQLPSAENYRCPATDTCPQPDSGREDAILQAASASGGVLTAISVTSPGSCYAWRTFSYSEPTATADSTTPLGSGAVFSVVWEQFQSSTTPPAWKVAAITAQGGSGYIDGDEIEITLGEGSCGSGFSGYIIANRTEPSISISLPGTGTGGDVSFTLLEESPACFSQFGVVDVVVAQGGTGYKDGDQITASVSGGGEEVEAAVLNAVVNRTIPQVTASAGSATLEVNLEQALDFSGKPYWQVASVSVLSGGGGGVSDGQQVVFSVVADVVIASPFAFAQVDEAGVVTGVEMNSGGVMYNDTGPIVDATISSSGYYCGASEGSSPTISLSVASAGGAGASLTAVTSTQRTVACYKTYKFETLTVVAAGDGYRDRDEISVTVNSGVTESAASLLVRVQRLEPSVTATVGDAELSVSLFEYQNANGDSVWTISSVSVVSGGSGMSNGDSVSFSIASGTVTFEPSAYVEVDGSGSVTSVILMSGGELADDVGPIDSAEIASAGEYWDTDTSAGCVVVESGGGYYKATATGVEVDTPTVRISSRCGQGATAEAVIDADPDSEGFGGVSSITVTDGGSGYFLESDVWIASIFTGGGIGHLTEPAFGGQYNPPEEIPDVFGESWFGNDYGFSDHESISNRTAALCPADLIGRSFHMYYSSDGGPLTDSNGSLCGKHYGSQNLTSGSFDTLVRQFAGVDIVIEVTAVQQ